MTGERFTLAACSVVATGRALLGINSEGDVIHARRELVELAAVVARVLVETDHQRRVGPLQEDDTVSVLHDLGDRCESKYFGVEGLTPGLLSHAQGRVVRSSHREIFSRRIREAL